MTTEPAPIAEEDRAALFAPLTIAGRTIPNRIVMSPMTRSFVIDGVVDDKAIDYYRRRAEGGTGLIITEGIAPSMDGAIATYAPRIDSPAAIDVWRRVVEAVHGAGGLIAAQLWHGGLMRGAQGPADPAGRALGPSPVYPLIAADGSVTAYATGAAMTQADIDQTVADCAAFARTARSIGFDGVEVHGAHGYLFDQFFWNAINQRDDGYNGGVAERSRFAAEAVRAIRVATADDFMIGLRFSQWKNPPEHYGNQMLRSAQDIRDFLAPLVAAGVDFFDCSTRRYWEPAFAGTDRTLAEWTRELSGKPTIAVGSVSVTQPLNTLDIGEVAPVTDNVGPLARMIREGKVDMVAIGRAIIANPDWANLVRNDQHDRLKPYSVEFLADLV